MVDRNFRLQHGFTFLEPRRRNPAKERFPHHSGFTLIELLIVVGIIVVLVAMFIPAIRTARRQAKITACAANLGQLTLAMNTYAVNNEGAYPSFAMPSPSCFGNTWDQSHAFYNALIALGLSHDSFFCPAAQDRNLAESVFPYNGLFYRMDYSFWVPRTVGTAVFPPAPTGSTFTVVSPTPQPFAGPVRKSDAIASTNPLVTDLAQSSGATPPANADATKSGNPWGFNPQTNHREGDRLLGVNLGFADGHVEVHSAADLKPYYQSHNSNAWNWR